MDSEAIQKVITDFKQQQRSHKQVIKWWRFMRRTVIYCTSFITIVRMCDQTIMEEVLKTEFAYTRK
jgi:hypothetical protein